MSGRFTISGSTLSLLSAGEQGVVARVTSADQTIVHKLSAMGVVPGTTLTLEQRSPRFKIRVDQHQFIIGHETAQAIYVRLTKALPMAKVAPILGFTQLTANWLESFAVKLTDLTLTKKTPSQSMVP